MINAEGEGNALTIAAPNVTVQGCTLTNWGSNLTKLNAAVFIQREASHAKVQANRMQGPASGIWVDGTSNVSLLDNVIEESCDCVRRIVAMAFISMPCTGAGHR